MKLDLNKIWQDTFSKLSSVRENLKSCIYTQDFERAKEIVIDLKSYPSCHYCKSFRQTLEERGGNGVCTICPLHRYGESIIKQPIGYNGCYRIQDYREMVKAAYWFAKDCSEPALKHVIACIDRVLSHFERARGILTVL